MMGVCLTLNSYLESDLPPIINGNTKDAERIKYSFHFEPTDYQPAGGLCQSGI